MAKLTFTINDFSGGVNGYVDPLDIADNELAQCQGFKAEPGTVIVLGDMKPVDASNGSYTIANSIEEGSAADIDIESGYGLFTFSNDGLISAAGTTNIGEFIVLRHGQEPSDDWFLDYELMEEQIAISDELKDTVTLEDTERYTLYERKIEHGAVIIATGAKEYKPKEYLYGEDLRVMTQVELSKRLEIRGAEDLTQVVMIQCVGSRNDKNPNCSRICCQSAIKNALHIKDLNPETEIIILYRDIRTYGFLEEYYREARQKGIIFCRYDADNPPHVESTDQGIKVTFEDHILQRDITLYADLLVLSAGVVAEDTEELASILKLQRNEEGYFMEAHVKLRPVDMVNDGIFVCGMAHSPKLIPEAIAQGLAAASRAATFLAQDSITLSAVTAKVNPELCAACLVCVRVCPFGVPRINEEGVSEIDEALCRGCGICASECPAKAIELSWYEDDQIISKIDALLEGEL